VAIWLQSRLGSALCLAALVVCFALTPDTSFIIGLCTVPLLLALCAANPVSKLFSHPSTYFLGEISFSIYLGHFLFSTIAYRIVSITWMQTGVIPLASGLFCIVVIVLSLSTLTYYAIERPGRGLLRGKKTAGRTTKVDPAGAI